MKRLATAKKIAQRQLELDLQYKEFEAWSKEHEGRLKQLAKKEDDSKDSKKESPKRGRTTSKRDGKRRRHRSETSSPNRRQKKRSRDASRGARAPGTPPRQRDRVAEELKKRRPITPTRRIKEEPMSDKEETKVQLQPRAPSKPPPDHLMTGQDQYMIPKAKTSAAPTRLVPAPPTSDRIHVPYMQPPPTPPPGQETQSIRDTNEGQNLWANWKPRWKDNTEQSDAGQSSKEWMTSSSWQNSKD